MTNDGIDPRDALRRLIAGVDLGRDETEDLFGQLMDGELSEPMKAALLTALAAKGESAEEMAGAALAMRRRVVPIPHQREVVVDTCGTGGDGKGTFNISTAAALVAAGAGAAVAKHGNRSVSSLSGSADVLEALGVDLDLEPEEAGRALDEIGIAFLFARRLHPAMGQVVEVRKEMGVRTIFNLLGPLTNPAGARRQILGVYRRELVETVGWVLAGLGAEHALVVHGSDGLDELTTTGPTLIAEVRGPEVEVTTFEPESLGLASGRLEDLRGGDPADNARQMEKLFERGEGPLADITALNAAAAIYVAGAAPSLVEGLEAAREALASGKAAEKLEALRRFGRQA